MTHSETLWEEKHISTAKVSPAHIWFFLIIQYALCSKFDYHHSDQSIERVKEKNLLCQAQWLVKISCEILISFKGVGLGLGLLLIYALKGSFILIISIPKS